MITIEPIEKLTTQLSRLPGIGRKTAQRLAYHILSVPEAQAKELADAITAARENVCNCPICGTYTDVIPCRICADDTAFDARVRRQVCDQTMDLLRDWYEEEITEEEYHFNSLIHDVLSIIEFRMKNRSVKLIYDISPDVPRVRFSARFSSST